ncbi:hypothetical protein NQ317_008055 [Molorchus minor]|uniref:Uncharacterized protein n=1 Tax=Molorchus minor TaxID=1323400 RepID=A0ABQ9IT67_9CUCU|nr:hypothetical protein NQ317_008055 [Molorchus minor]
MASLRELHQIIQRKPTVTIELEWSQPLQTYGELKGYRVRYGEKEQYLKVNLKGKLSDIEGLGSLYIGKDPPLSYYKNRGSSNPSGDSM